MVVFLGSRINMNYNTAPSAALLVFAEWYHLETIGKLRFYDDNTRSWWDAATGDWRHVIASNSMQWCPTNMLMYSSFQGVFLTVSTAVHVGLPCPRSYNRSMQHWSITSAVQVVPTSLPSTTCWCHMASPLLQVHTVTLSLVLTWRQPQCQGCFLVVMLLLSAVLSWLACVPGF